MEIVLVPGALVGASGLMALADALVARSAAVTLPDVLSAARDLTAWPEWPERLIEVAAPPVDAVLVGYSASTVLVAAVARRVAAAGLILLDGDIPPDGGAVLPGSARLRELVAKKAQATGGAVIWSDLFDDKELRDNLGLSQLEKDTEAFARFRAEQPRLTPEWFAAPIELEAWRTTPAAVLRTSRFGEAAAVEATALGWPVRRLDGTHLHATLAPEETASAIIELIACLQR